MTDKTRRFILILKIMKWFFITVAFFVCLLSTLWTLVAVTSTVLAIVAFLALEEIKELTEQEQP